MSAGTREEGGREAAGAARRVEDGAPGRRSGDGASGRRRGPWSDDTSESNQTLWLLAASPTVWVAHFLASYLGAAVWCAKVAGRTGSLYEVRVGVGVITALALAAIAVVAWIGYRRHSFGAATVPHDFDTPGDRHRFLGFSTVLLSALSAVGVLYVGSVVLFMRTCL